jgi:hypothetical protein
MHGPEVLSFIVPVGFQVLRSLYRKCSTCWMAILYYLYWNFCESIRIHVKRNCCLCWWWITQTWLQSLPHLCSAPPIRLRTTLFWVIMQRVGVISNQYRLRNNSEELSSQILRGGGLKSLLSYRNMWNFSLFLDHSLVVVLQHSNNLNFTWMSLFR